MKNCILVIDDERPQAEGLCNSLKTQRPDFYVESAYEELDILSRIDTMYYNFAVVDLQMDKYEIDGIQVIKKIIGINPFAKIIIVSAYLESYADSIVETAKTGKILARIDKETPKVLTANILRIIDAEIAEQELNQNQREVQLLAAFAEAKNETTAYNRGEKFERFTTNLFGQMGFQHIYKRVKEKKYQRNRFGFKK
jgi:ActR/RegA family two-component response regulator